LAIVENDHPPHAGGFYFNLRSKIFFGDAFGEISA
jgi:hypothetical protein